MARSYRFGDFRLDPATRELWRGSSPVAVPPRAFDCIVYLLEHRERAVGRDELIAAVWGRTETGDGTLGQTVLAARRALDDTGKEQHVIRTVFRFGYHWVAPVDVVEEAAEPPAEPKPVEAASSEAAPEPAAAPVRTRERDYRPWVLATLAAIVVAALVLAFVARRDAVAPPPGADAHGTIALVLPVTVTASPGFDWVRLGLMDLIGSRLRAAGLPVVPSDNVVALTSPSKPIDDVGRLARETGANLAIEARAEQTGARWRVTLRTVLGRNPELTAVGEATDVLAAARIAADRMAQQLGYTPAPDGGGDAGTPSAGLSQQIEAAMLSDRLDVARALIAHAPADERDSPELRLRAAQIDYQAGDFDRAEAGFNAVAEAASAEQEPVLHARAIQNLGVIAAVRDNPALARRRFDEAIDLLRGQNAPDALGKALNARANIAAYSDRYDDALRDFAEARVAFESTGNLLALAVLDSNLAASDMHRYHYAEAEPVFERAAARFATFGVNAAELNAWIGAAELKLSLLEPDAALAMEPRLRELIAKVADPARKRNAELTRIEVLIANGRLREAEQALAVVTEAAAQTEDRVAIARSHIVAARLAAARADPERAARESELALSKMGAPDDNRERARVFHLRIAALLNAGETAAAKGVLALFDQFAAQVQDRPVAFYRSLARAQCAAADGQNAGDAFLDAMSRADESRIPLDLRVVAATYVRWLIATGELAKAGAASERVAGWVVRDYDAAIVQLQLAKSLRNVDLWRKALTRVQSLAGERVVPPDLSEAPVSS